MDAERLSQKEQMLKAFTRLKQLVILTHADISAKYEKIGLSISELELMREIKHNTLDSDNNTRISDIKNLLYISKAGISKKLNTLEEKGHITRTIDKNNRRQLIVTLTERGQEALKDMEQNTERLYATVLQKLGEEQTKQFVQLLGEVVDIMNDTLLVNTKGSDIE